MMPTNATKVGNSIPFGIHGIRAITVKMIHGTTIAATPPNVRRRCSAMHDAQHGTRTVVTSNTATPGSRVRRFSP